MSCTECEIIIAINLKSEFATTIKKTESQNKLLISISAEKK